MRAPWQWEGMQVGKMAEERDGTANERGLPAYVDGRQSAAALEIARGTTRYLRELGFECVSEVTLGDGRRADLLGISGKGEIWIVEIKSSLADFQSDGKWGDYDAHCDRFSFAVNGGFPIDVLPDDVGLIVADRYFGDELRAPCRTPLSGARRKAVLIRYGRAAAARVNGLADPLATGRALPTGS